MANDKTKPRFTLELPPEEDEQLDVASKQNGETKRQIVRTALKLYFGLCLEVYHGGTVLVRKSTGEMVQLQI